MSKDEKKRDPHALYCDDPSLTKQSFAEECSIDEILRRAQNGQDISGSLSGRVARYGDFTNVPNFHEAQNLIARANAAFMELPWQVRERFSNDPAVMVEFLQHDENYEEALKLGLLSPEAVEKRRKASQAPPTPPAGPPAGGSPTSKPI